MVMLAKTFSLSLKVTENIYYSWKANICQAIQTHLRVSFPPLHSYRLSPWLNLSPWLDGDKKKLKSHQGGKCTFILRRTAMGKHHATFSRLVCLIKNCKAGAALQGDAGSRFCAIKYTDRERSQMVSQQPKFSKTHFLPWEVLDWQLWKQVFYLSTGSTGKASNIVPAEVYRNHLPFHFHPYEVLASSVQTAEEGVICTFDPDLSPQYFW